MIYNNKNPTLLPEVGFSHFFALSIRELRRKMHPQSIIEIVPSHLSLSSSLHRTIELREDKYSLCCDSLSYFLSPLCKDRKT